MSCANLVFQMRMVRTQRLDWAGQHFDITALANMWTERRQWTGKGVSDEVARELAAIRAKRVRA